ncbi:putative small heat shock protein HSP20 [Lupinus albus]|uniref:Putative small heat shock protein HSP20 n=1 Tax=Lupinus albus TaxID=3870 RepID=A0A6A4PCL8_LUPAL|nr:putative small heat shock protein HSP20 [Lupinus albus]
MEFLSPSHFVPYNFIPQNYVHWTETPQSHIFSANIPGVRKEELRVEVEDSIYLIIRTEAIDESIEAARKFKRKFRIPCRVDIDGITAVYENGVLTVTVPRSIRRSFYIDPASVSDRLEVIAKAA